MFAFRIDVRRKLVRVEVTHILSVPEADALGEELLANAAAARRRFGLFRLLVDARLSPLQPAAVVARFHSPGEVLKGEDERYAVVLGSALSKLQANRILDDDRARAFMTIDAAESWLSGHGDPEDSGRVPPDGSARPRY